MRGKVKRVRLDLAMLEQGLAESRERARALILAGNVLVDGRVVDKAGTPVDTAQELRSKPRRTPMWGEGA